MASKTERELRREISKQDSDRIRQIERFVARVERSVERALDSVLTDLAGGSLGPLEASAAFNSLSVTLRETGLNDVADELYAIYGAEVDRALTFVGIGTDSRIGRAQVDLEVVQALVEYGRNKLFNITDTIVFDVQQAVVQQVITGQKIDVNQFSQLTNERNLADLETEIRTESQALNRTLQAQQAEQLGLEQYIYLGPEDNATRKFCRDVLTRRTPPIYTRAEIDSMDNGQLGPVITYGGGYNCRHQFFPISDEKASEIRSE